MAQPFDHYNIYTDSTTPIGFRLAPVFKVDEKKKRYMFITGQNLNTRHHIRSIVMIFRSAVRYYKMPLNQEKSRNNEDGYLLRTMLPYGD